MFSGCNSKGTKTNPPAESNGKIENKVTLDEIKKGYSDTDEKILNIQEYGSYILVESQAPTFANKFTFYNLKTGDKDILPKGADFIDSAKIVDENHIILYAKGTNSESPLEVFPFEIECVRDAENINSEGDFFAVYRDYKLPVDKKLSLKGKQKVQISDIRVTVNGLQVCFGPQIPDDPGFYADYTDAPSMDMFFNRDNREFSITFKDTILGKPYEGKASLPYSNTYIKSMKLSRMGDSTVITMQLNKAAVYYKGSKDSIFEYGEDIDIPYIDIQFFGSDE
jgi:hypothetical protein